LDLIGPRRIIEDLLRQRGRVLKNGVTNCINPSHEDGNASMSVNLDRGVFNCFGCGEHGGALAMGTLCGIGTNEADTAKNLATFYGLDKENGHNANGHTNGTAKAPPREWPYFPRTAEALGWAPCQSRDGRPGLRLPTFHADGSPGTFKERYRKDPTKTHPTGISIKEEGRSAGMENLDRFLDVAAGTDTPSVAIVCGETDLLAWTFHAQQEGIDIVAVSSAAGETKSLLDFLPAFRGAKVYFFPDNDEPGAKSGADRFAELTTVAKSLHVTHVPDPHKDVCEYLMAGGTVRELLRLAEGTPEPWPDPVPVSRFGVPEFPYKNLHPKLKDWIEDIAKGAQVAPDMPGTILLSVLSTCLAKKFEIKVGGRWVEPLNLWTMVAARSGERKTPILTEAKAPLVSYEADRQIAERQGIIRQQATYKAAESRLSIASKALAKNPGDGGLIDAHEAAIKNLAETPEPKRAFRLLGDDTTPESLVSLMAHQDERLALFSSEGGMLKTVMGAQYSAHGLANRDVLLKTFSGEAITQDRKNTASNSLRHPALTLGLFVQPAVLDKLIHDPENSDLGLLARFLLCNAPSQIGYRDVELFEPDMMTTGLFRSHIKELLEIPVPEKPDIIPLAKDALEALNAFRAEIEQRMQPDKDLFHYTDFGAKIPGHAVRIAGNLAISESYFRLDGCPREIPLAPMQIGIDLARYYLAHAIRAINEAELDPDTQAAKRILAWIERHYTPVVEVRDVFRGLMGPRSSIQKVEQLARPLKALCTAGWLRPVGASRDMAKSYAVHPEFVCRIISEDATPKSAS
jgi:hypothetical protein